MAAVDLQKLEINFLAQLDTKEKLGEFLKFAALHPELSFDNICLLYMQDPEAPRYVVHKGLAQFYGYSMDKPFGLYDLTLNEGSPEYKDGIFYLVPEKQVLPKMKVAMDFGGIFDRIQYTLSPSDDVTGFVPNEEYRRLSYPSRWDNETKNDALLGFLVDYFWKAYRSRENIIRITDEQFRKYYRKAIIFMATSLLGYKEAILSKPFFLFTNDRYSRKKRLSDLFFLFVEFDQMLEGRHFTMYETLLFHLSGGNPFNDVIAINSPDPRDPFVSYEMMILRYVNDRLEETPESIVHIYPPFRYDEN